ncbi:MAG: carbamoyl-phosphate synthase, partial [Myxococcaceae bacterium]
LPALVYEAALGCRDTLRFEVARARAWVPEGRHIYAHRALLGLVLAVQELAGGASGQEARRWRNWLFENRARAADAVADDGDRLPGLVDLALHLTHHTRHPRAFVRSVALDR